MAVQVRRRARPVVLAVGRPDADPVVGVEHEYEVSAGGCRVDFRRIIHELDLGVRGLDPADPNACRGTWGGVITADGREAEVVSPPVALGAGGTASVEAFTARGRAELARALGAEATLAGYSTHLNVEVPRGREVAVARRVARHFAPALMLMMDQPSSPGLLVRPRPGRLEVGGEYLAGGHLRAALVLGAGAVGACGHARGLPPAASATVAPAVERFGWYVDRAAFGTDLYRHGRRARLPLAGARPGVRSASAQALLARAWEVARPHAETWATRDELLLVDAIVDGRQPLPLEGPLDVAPRPDGGVEASPFGAALAVRHRPGYDLGVVVATWPLVVFEVTGARRPAFVAVPRPHLAGFLAALDAGTVDGDIGAFLAQGDRGRVLVAADEVTGPTLFDRLGDTSRLVPAERDPGTGRLMGPGGTSPGQRPGKDRSARGQPGPARARSRTRLLVAGAVVALVVLAAVVAGAVASGDEETAAPTASTTTTAPEPGGTAEGVGPVTSSTQITYLGTLTAQSDGEPFVTPDSIVGIACSDEAGEDCNLVGWAVGGHQVIDLVREAPDRFTADLTGPGRTSCDGPPGPVDTVVTIDLEGTSMILEASTAGSVVDCADGGTLEDLATTYTFEGTYSDGTIPGWDPGG